MPIRSTTRRWIWSSWRPCRRCRCECTTACARTRPRCCANGTCPATHYLEHWSDARAFDGTLSVVQPLVAPLYGSKSVHEFVALLAGKPGSAGYDLLRESWKATLGAPADFETRWQRAVHDGFLAGSRVDARSVSLKRFDAGAAPAEMNAGGELELALRPDPSIFDGRFANNGWLQEVPKPLSKLTWDNALYLSPETAKSRGVQSGDVVELTHAGRKLKLAVWVQPGQAPNVGTLHLGFGRTRAGKIGNGPGFNAYALRTHAAPWGGSATIAKTGETYSLACAQELGHGDRPVHLHRLQRLRHRLPGREQHPDRRQGPGGPRARDALDPHRPLLRRRRAAARGVPPSRPCMQCENAPCEWSARWRHHHSEEGLNEMVYNRCVGTRYCSNNCPYKVRRFNFLLYSDWTPPSLKLQRNPDVTVRSRGVMEKCTYCVQRISQARIEAKREDRRIRDGEVVTACQQVCPSQAIVFGDLNDKQSAVRARKSAPHNYGLLTELNTAPRTTYLSRVSNPNPELAGA
jgi:Fe-S-cluster-containing dehydrogenase component